MRAGYLWDSDACQSRLNNSTQIIEPVRSVEPINPDEDPGTCLGQGWDGGGRYRPGVCLILLDNGVLQV